MLIFRRRQKFCFLPNPIGKQNKKRQPFCVTVNESVTLARLPKENVIKVTVI